MSEAYFIHPAAQEEFHDALIYYASLDETGVLALDFADTFQGCLDRIIANPLSYQTRKSEIRQANLKPRFSECYIAYTIQRNRIVILALGHNKRRPSIWSGRGRDTESIVDSQAGLQLQEGASPVAKF